MKKIGELNAKERAAVVHTLPSLVGDYCLDQQQFAEAVEFFLIGKDEASAVRGTEGAIAEAKNGSGDIVRVVQLWNHFGNYSGSNKSVVDLLVLFNSPQEAAKRGALMFQRFGHHIVRLAVQQCSISDDLLLYSFDHIIFRKEVENVLIQRHCDVPIQIVRFYMEHNDKDNALNFAEGRLESWSRDDLVSRIFGELSLRSEGVIVEIQRRGFLLEAIMSCLCPPTRDVDMAQRLSNLVLKSTKSASVEHAEELVRAWQQYPENAQVLNRQTQRKGTASSLIALLLKLFDHPEVTGQKFGGECMQKFGQDVVQKAVSNTFRSNNQKFYKVLSYFDKKAFEAYKPSATNPVMSTFTVGDRVRTKGLSNKLYNGVSNV